MSEGALTRVETWGERMARAARRIAARSLPALAVSRIAAPVLARAGSLPTPADGRFRRVPARVGPARAGSARFGPEPPATVERDLPGAARSGGPAPSPAQSFGRSLPPHVERSLEPMGPGVRAMRVHDDGAADEFARAHRADAVTVGPEVFFRDGAFEPEQPAGLALIAHEAIHVLSAMRPDAAFRRATTEGVLDEERRALAEERATLATAPLSPRPAHATSAVPVGPIARAGAAHAHAAAHPMRAAEDRGGAGAAAPAPSSDDLRRTIYRDLMAQLKVDFERGG